MTLINSILIKPVSAVLFIIACSNAIGAVITVEGVYQGKNLYVQNPFTSSGVGFCTIEVLVNDVKSTDEIQSSAYEIDFANFKLRMGDKVVIKIKHKDDCAPKVLNPEVLKPSSTFQIVSIKAEDGVVKWTTKNESGPMPFIVEQFRWNKWIKVAEVAGKGLPENQSYSAKVSNHPGINKFRIQQTDFKGPRYSNPVEYKSNAPEVTFYPIKVTKDITFSAETMYEIYDQTGKLILNGTGLKIDASSLAKGPYYLSYDNKIGNFIKK